MPPILSPRPLLFPCEMTVARLEMRDANSQCIRSIGGWCLTKPKYGSHHEGHLVFCRGTTTDGGLPMGQVIGETTPDGGRPAKDPVTIANLYATIMHTLLDIGELRITHSHMRDVLNIATAAEPIPGLKM
jgi:hypothetical protein